MMLSLIDRDRNADLGSIDVEYLKFAIKMISLKKAISSLMLLIIASSLTTDVRAEEINIPEQELLIWRVDPKPGSIYSVYILGSYHVGKNCQINSPAFEHAFKDAETVVFEVDSIHNLDLLAQKSQKHITKSIVQKGIPLNPSNSLKETLDPQTYELLKEQTDAVKFPLDNFALFKPWVFMFTYLSFQTAQSEYKGECGLDAMIAEKSENRKDIEGLESLEYQLDKYIDLFVSMDADEMLDSIKAMSKAKSTEISDYFSQEVDSLTSLVDSGDLDSLEYSINSWCDRDLEECESLLYERNRNWIPKIEQFLGQEKDSLVVVGAGHLVGEQNVIKLLKQKGYTVRRFYNSFRLTEE